jgi:hypothetical protein
MMSAILIFIFVKNEMCINEKRFPWWLHVAKKAYLNSNSFPIKNYRFYKVSPRKLRYWSEKKFHCNNLLITLALDFSILFFKHLFFIIRAMKMRLPTRAVISYGIKQSYEFKTSCQVIVSIGKHLRCNSTSFSSNRTFFYKHSHFGSRLKCTRDEALNNGNDQNIVNVPVEGVNTDTQRLDVYHRFVWTKIEGPTMGSYSWRFFDSLVNDAIARKQKMSFGIMPLYPGEQRNRA